MHPRAAPIAPRLLILALSAVLVAGPTTAAAARATAARAAAARAAAARYAVEPSDTYLLAVTGADGLFGFLGHDHAVEARQVSGAMRYLPDAPPGERLQGEIVIDATALQIDTPEARQRAALGGGPSGDDLEKVRRIFHGPDGLDTGRYPVIRFRPTAVEPNGVGTGPEAITRVTGDLTLHGRTRRVSLPIAVEASNGGLVARGRTRIRQTDFGIEPQRVAGGLVKVRDEVEVSLALHLAPR
ncbi:MAG TPA: YceI family protein [Thermodesulfobacteriota bacterium]